MTFKFIRSGVASKQRGFSLLEMMVIIGIMSGFFAALAALMQGAGKLNKNADQGTAIRGAVTAVERVFEDAARCQCILETRHSISFLSDGSATTTLPDIPAVNPTGCTVTSMIMTDGAALPNEPNIITDIDIDNEVLINGDTTSAAQYLVDIIIRAQFAQTSSMGAMTRTYRVPVAVTADTSDGTNAVIDGCLGLADDPIPPHTQFRMQDGGPGTVILTHVGGAGMSPLMSENITVRFNDGTTATNDTSNESWNMVVGELDGSPNDAASTFYYLYAIPDGSGGFDIIGSTRVPFAPPVAAGGGQGPNGEPVYSYLGAVYNDAGQNILPFINDGNNFYFEQPQLEVSGTADFAEAPVAWQFIPPTAGAAILQLRLQRDNTWGPPAGLVYQKIGSRQHDDGFWADPNIPNVPAGTVMPFFNQQVTTLRDVKTTQIELPLLIPANLTGVPPANQHYFRYEVITLTPPERVGRHSVHSVGWRDPYRHTQ